MRGESGISLTGLYLCSVITLIILILKLSHIESWSWWRVLLPIGFIVGFNIIHVVVAFTYLSFADIPERTNGDEVDVLEPHTLNGLYLAAMLFFIVFADNVVRWIEGSETSHWFWLLSGKVQAVAVFGVLSVLALFSYWLRLGRALKTPD